MKLNFTTSKALPVLMAGIIAISFTGLYAQNIANLNISQQKNADDRSAGIASWSSKIIVNNHQNQDNKIFSGNIQAGNFQQITITGSVANAPFNNPETTYQYDLSQNDLGDLYKLLALYKSQAEKGKSIIILRQKKNAGQINDSFLNARKYVVADDLSGFIPPSNNVDALPNIIIPTIEGVNNNNTGELLTGSTAGISITNSIDVSETVSLFPNPARNSITVDLSQLKGAELMIYNVDGRLVKKVISGYNNPTQIIDISELNSGYYVLNISTADASAMKKFSVIK